MSTYYRSASLIRKTTFELTKPIDPNSSSNPSSHYECPLLKNLSKKYLMHQYLVPTHHAIDFNTPVLISIIKHSGGS